MPTPQDLAEFLLLKRQQPAVDPQSVAMARALVSPPRTSVAPEWLDAAIAQGVKKGAKNSGYYLTLPGMAMVPQQPETLGQWSDVDEARQQLNERAKADWAAQTGFGMVFDPLALARKPNH